MSSDADGLVSLARGFKVGGPRVVDDEEGVCLDNAVSGGSTKSFLCISLEPSKVKDGTSGSNFVLRAFGVESGDFGSAEESAMMDGDELAFITGV